MKGEGEKSPRQRIGAKLKFHHLTRGAFAAFHVKRRARADAGPKSPSFPAGGGIVDSPINPLRVEAQRVGNAKDHPFAILQGQETFGLVACIDRNVGSQTERIELVDPSVVARLGAARTVETLQLR